MATAKFNRTLTAPTDVEKIEYDLNAVITTTGFVDRIGYSAKGLPNGVILEGNILAVYPEAAGNIVEITLSDDYKNSAFASTKIITFESVLSDFSKNKSMDEKLSKTKQSWNSIIGGDAKVKGVEDTVKGK